MLAEGAIMIRKPILVSQMNISEVKATGSAA